MTLGKSGGKNRTLSSFVTWSQAGATARSAAASAKQVRTTTPARRVTRREINANISGCHSAAAPAGGSARRRAITRRRADPPVIAVPRHPPSLTRRPNIVDDAPECQRKWPVRPGRPIPSGPLSACTTRAEHDAEMPDSGTGPLPWGLRCPRDSFRSTPGSDGRVGGTEETPASPRRPDPGAPSRRSGRRECRRPERNHPYVSASFVNQLARDWTGRLAHYAAHHNDEHRLAIFEEAARYAGLHLENDLARSEFWTRSPLHQRAAVLLFLVDRGVVERTTRRGRRVMSRCARGVLVGGPAVAASLSRAGPRIPEGPPPRAPAPRPFVASLRAAVRHAPTVPGRRVHQPAPASVPQAARISLPPEYRRTTGWPT